MQILQWLVLGLLVTIVPFLLGTIPVKYMNRFQRTPAMMYLCGWFVSFSVFELVSVPFILLERSFTEVVVIYSLVIMILLVVSVWNGYKVIAQLWSWKSWWKDVAKMSWWTRLGWLVVAILLVIQLIHAVVFEYYDGDDSYYVAQAVMTKTFNTMYLRDNYTGYIYPLDIRHALSPTPVYIAWMSKVSGIHPTVIAHSVLSVAWLVLMYCIYEQIGKRLLAKNKDWIPLFLIFIEVWFLYGNISLYTSETFAMTRTWQGKGLMAGVILPALLLSLIYLADQKTRFGNWLLFLTVILSAVFATSIAFMLIPTIVGLSAVLIGWQKRSAKTVLLMGAGCLPCILLGFCYLMLR
ncbi:MAG: hypothetical protein IJN64_08550 [Lachnospiraceae bacterium]|nr:hypothetical protein [Lachnospiraceae bacterium]